MKTKNPKLKAAGAGVADLGIAGAGGYAALKARQNKQA